LTGAGPATQRLVCVGKVVGVHGVGGWIKLHSYTRARGDVFDYRRWIVGEGPRATALDLVQYRMQGRGLVAKLADIDDRDAAAARIGDYIWVPAGSLPPAEEGEYFWHQLEGLEVRTVDDVPLGRVEYLIETGANDVMVVCGDRERLLPWTDAVIRRVDLERGTILVDWDPGF